MDLMQYQESLSGLMYERFRMSPPSRYKAALVVANNLPRFLSGTAFPVFLQAALDGYERSQRPERSLTWSFTTYFGLEVHRVLGDLDEQPEGAHQAWQFMRQLHDDFLPGDEFPAFVRWMQQALEQAEVVQKRLAELREPRQLAGAGPVSL